MRGMWLVFIPAALFGLVWLVSGYWARRNRLPAIKIVIGSMGKFYECSRCKAISNFSSADIMHHRSCLHSQKR